MPTTDELRSGPGVGFANAILIHGINLVFVDHAGLVGYNFGGSRTARLGLKREGLTYGEAISLRRSEIEDRTTRFTIIDFEDDLARLFGAVDDTEQSLGDVPIGAGLPIRPSDSLAARTDLHDKHIGTERIGPAGERALYPSPSGFQVGSHHTIAVPGIDLAGAPVSDNPIVWAGRRITLYRIYRDLDTNFRPFSEAKVEWWGTLRDAGRVSGREWTLEADGASSWLRKPLAVGFQTTPVRAVGDVSLSSTPGDDETGMGVRLWVKHAFLQDVNAIPNDNYGERMFVTAITGATPDAVRQDVIDEIEAATLAAGIDGVWADQAGFHASMGNNSEIHVAVDENDESVGWLEVCLHRKVWEILGYDLELQPTLDLDDPRHVFFDQVIGGNFNDALELADDYWVGAFPTGDINEIWPLGENTGGNKIYQPQYQGGTAVLLHKLNSGRGQVIKLADAALGDDVTGATVAHPGQHDRPVASDPDDPTAPIEIDGVPCDRQGLWLFYGKRRFSGSEDVFDEFWVGRGSWTSGAAQQDGLIAGDTIIITEWLNASRFGFPRGYPQSDWVALESTLDPDEGMIQAIPLCHLGYAEGSAYERAQIVAQRLLYSTGTSDGWTSYSDDPDATADPGDNEPVHTMTNVRDAEVAELSLGVPSAFIHNPSDWHAQASKIENDDILDVKVAFTGGYQAEDVLRSLLQPIGWCWHLRGGKYGIWCPADSVTLEDADVTLDRSKKVREYGERFTESRQEIRKFQPVDKWTYELNANPQTKSVGSKVEMLSPDAGFRYRPGEVNEVIKAHHHRRPKGIAERVSHLSRFWSQRHFEVKNWPVDPIDPGEDCWPGTIVRITDPTLVDVLGEYGVTARLGVITACTTTLGVDDCSKTIDLMVFGTRTNIPRLHSVSARAVGYDTSTRTLYTADNWLGIETADDSWLDAPLFSEPLYTGIAQFGGAAYIRCYQWDGATWSATLEGPVASTGDNTIVLTAAATGTYYRDMDTIVVIAGADDQTSTTVWPCMIYSPICNPAGNFTDADANFADGYPWEQ